MAIYNNDIDPNVTQWENEQNINKARCLLTFENGKTVISNDQSYITLITWEKMFGSKIVNNQPIN